MEQIYRVKTSAHRNKGDVRYGTGFRAKRIWLANLKDADCEVTVEVMNGVFLDVTSEWEAGNFEAGKQSVPVSDSTNGNADGDGNNRIATGTGWPDIRSGDSGSSGNVDYTTPNQ